MFSAQHHETERSFSVDAVAPSRSIALFVEESDCDLLRPMGFGSDSDLSRPKGVSPETTQ